jgi:hypothetical protein
MHIRTKILITAVVATVLSFAGFVSCAWYAAIDEPNMGAALLALLLLFPTIGFGIWAVVAFVLFLRRDNSTRGRGFSVIDPPQDQ